MSPNKNSTENSNGFGSGLVLLVALLLVIYVLDWGFLFGRITNYPVWCPDDFYEGNGCMTVRTTNYYPDKKTQTVKVRSDFEIKTLKKCSVINRKNWECKHKDESATFGFVDGKFHSTTLWSNRPADEVLKEDLEYRYVSRLRYLLEDWHIL